MVLLEEKWRQLDHAGGALVRIPPSVRGRQIPCPHSIEGPILVKGARGAPERKDVGEQLPRERWARKQSRKDSRWCRRAAALAEQAETIQLDNRLPKVLLNAASGPDVRENELGYLMTLCRYRLGVLTGGSPRWFRLRPLDHLLAKVA